MSRYDPRRCSPWSRDWLYVVTTDTHHATTNHVIYDFCLCVCATPAHATRHPRSSSASVNTCCSQRARTAKGVAAGSESSRHAVCASFWVEKKAGCVQCRAIPYGLIRQLVQMYIFTSAVARSAACLPHRLRWCLPARTECWRLRLTVAGRPR